MNIICCKSCGILLNADFAGFPDSIYVNTGTEIEVDLSKATWDGDEWVAKVECPVCKSEILKSERA